VTWDAASQLDLVSTDSGLSRDYTFNDLGRMTSDVLSDASLATVASFGYGYGYDTDGNLTSKSVGLAGNPQSGAHTFGYDHQGRLIGWTGPSGTVAYTWDDRGNRLTAGADVYTYDERNRMLSGPCIALGFLETLDLGSEDGVMSKNQMAPTTRRYSAEFKDDHAH
jgi:YD repeat-containing protein